MSDLYLTNSTSPDVVNPSTTTKVYRKAQIGAGASTVAVSPRTNTVAGPTTGVQVGNAGLSLPTFWFTDMLSAFNCTGTLTFAMWGIESAMAANVGFQCVIERCSSDGTVVSTVANSEFGTELSNTVTSLNSWTAAPTTTAFSQNDRLRITVWGNDAGGNMATANTFDLSHGVDNSTATSGASFVRLTETLSTSTGAASTGGGTAANDPMLRMMMGVGMKHRWEPTPIYVQSQRRASF
jgi:hypothetical protein